MPVIVNQLLTKMGPKNFICLSVKIINLKFNRKKPCPKKLHFRAKSPETPTLTLNGYEKCRATAYSTLKNH